MMSPEEAIDAEIWARIKAKFVRDPFSGCWIWFGASHDKGYGRIKIDGVLHPVHRYVYERCAGIELPRNVLACHRCDIPSCVNPAHVFPGSILDNNQDSVAKGRNAFGERAGNSTISDSVARLIAKSEGKYSVIAKTFNTTEIVVRDIKQGKRWKSVVDTKPVQSRAGYFRKLTPESVRAIRSDSSRTVDAATKFGVSNVMIRRIRRGDSYRHLIQEPGNG